MSGTLSPWLWLLVGFLAGWIVEWLLDLFVFRPRETADLRRQVANLQAELAEALRKAEHTSQVAGAVLADADAPATELDRATPQARAEAAATPPVVRAEVPAATGAQEPAAPQPEEEAASQVQAQAPEVEPGLPEPAAEVKETDETKE